MPKEEEKEEGGGKKQWIIAGKLCSKEALMYFLRMLMLYFICIVSCINITLGKGPQQVWITFLSASLGGIGITLFNNRK